MAYVALGCRCMVGLVFAASVLGKLRGRESYARFVAAAGPAGTGAGALPDPGTRGGRWCDRG